jgi:hypothetical protein
VLARRSGHLAGAAINSAVVRIAFGGQKNGDAARRKAQSETDQATDVYAARRRGNREFGNRARDEVTELGTTSACSNEPRSCLPS